MTNNDCEDCVALTIAGFDPSGGAGILADVRTFTAFECRPAAALTSLTFQNSSGVFGATHESGASLRAQVLPIIEEFQVTALKIGMLPTRELVSEIVRLLPETNLPAPVVDPVLQSSSGYKLVEDEAIDGLLSELMPLARLITPNISEAERLTCLQIANEEGMRAAAQKLRESGARAVLIKGGHLYEKADRDRKSKSPDSREAIDLLDDQGEIIVFRSPWIEAEPVRGSGCMLSAGIAACLGRGLTLRESIQLAREFVASAIRLAQN